MMNYTYILRCADESLYCGWTNHLWKRICAHNHGKGAKYTRGRGPVKLVYYEMFETKEEALRREAAIKSLTRKDKQQLIESQPDYGCVDKIRDKVHHLYCELDLRGKSPSPMSGGMCCAGTTLCSLGELFHYDLQDETLRAAVGLNGAGGFGAQCGLVEGTLMFIGIYGAEKGLQDEGLVSLCCQFAEAFTEMFGSLCCNGLRPGGFIENDPQYNCEELTVQAILFAYRFITRFTGAYCTDPASPTS